MPMKTGTRRRDPKPIGDTSIPDGFAFWGEKFLEWLAVHNQSDKTVVTRRLQIRLFAEWCQERSLTRPSEITRPILERYQRHLFYCRRPDGRPLSFRTQHSMLQGLKAFFRWLAKRNAISANPAADLDMPRLPVRLPPPVLSHDEVERVMDQPDVSSVIGIRDRAIIEVLYSTAMRRSELAALKVFDIDPARHVVYIRQGKGKKDRVVPIGTRALGWIARYRDEARPKPVIEPDDGTLFLSTTGEALSPETLTHYVRAYVVAADIGKIGACHLLRHTVATLMLEAGADVRFVQELLGHADISTTQIYTRVSIKALQVVHAATHPGATSEDRGTSASPRLDDDEAKALLDALADEDPEGWPTSWRGAAGSCSLETAPGVTTSGATEAPGHGDGFDGTMPGETATSAAEGRWIG